MQMNDTDSDTHVKDHSGELIMDIINFEPILKNRCIQLNNHMYDVATIYIWLNTCTDDRKDPFRQPVSDAKFIEIKDKYFDAISPLSRDQVKKQMRDILLQQYELILGMNYYPQTAYGIQMITNTNKEIERLDVESDKLLCNYPWLKSSTIMNDVIKHESFALKKTLERWIKSLDN